MSRKPCNRTTRRNATTNAPALNVRGLATEAVRELLRLVERRRDVVRVVAHTPLDRPESARVVEKAGFVFVGEIEDTHEGVTLRVKEWEHVAPTKEQWDAAWAGIKRAVERVKQGLPPNEPCAFCGAAIRVESLPSDTTFLFGCPCGRSTGSLKGI